MNRSVLTHCFLGDGTIECAFSHQQQDRKKYSKLKSIFLKRIPILIYNLIAEFLSRTLIITKIFIVCTDYPVHPLTPTANLESEQVFAGAGRKCVVSGVTKLTEVHMI